MSLGSLTHRNQIIVATKLRNPIFEPLAYYVDTASIRLNASLYTGTS